MYCTAQKVSSSYQASKWKGYVQVAYENANINYDNKIDVKAWSFTAMMREERSHRTASMMNSHYWFQLASKRKCECRFSFTTKLDTVGNSCMQNTPVGELTTCIQTTGVLF